MSSDLLTELANRYGITEEDRVRLSTQLRAPLPMEPEPTHLPDLTAFPDDTILPDVVPIKDRPSALRDPGGRYEAMAVLGRGGMGEVHRVWDRVLERAVAMKIILPMRSGHSGVIARFEQEARLTAQLQHPGIIAIYDLGRLYDGRLFITMEEVRGQSLAQVLHQRPALSHRLRLLAETAEAIAYAHSHGVLHRDLKPGNIMVVGFDDIKIVDWGLAGRMPGRARPGTAAPPHPRSTDTQSTGYPGTPAYMAPELFGAEPSTTAADVYALGVILHQCLTSSLPFPEAGFSAQARRIRAGRTTPPPLPRTVPRPLARLCEAALYPAPEARPAATDMAAALKSWLNGEVQREAAMVMVHEADETREELEDLQLCADDLHAQGKESLKDVPRWAPIAQKQPGWQSLDEAAAMRQEALRMELRYLEQLQQALVLSPGLPEAHDRLASWHRARHAEAEADSRELARVRAEVQLIAHDRGSHRRYLDGTGALTLITEPPGAAVTLMRYTTRDRMLVAEPLESPGITPLKKLPLPMGSYLLLLEHPDCEPVRYPVHIRRQAHWRGSRPGATAPTPVWLPPRGTLSEDEVYVPGGWFTRGADPTTNALHRDRIWVEGFIMRRYPVTVAEYRLFQRAIGEAPVVGEADWPIDGVSWEQAWRYCQWKSSQTGLPWRLPGEWEWEKAARGVDGRHYPWGNHGDDAMACTRHAHPDDIPQRAPVTAFPTDVSVYGVRGMGGGVQQWCGDDNLWGSPVEGGIAVPYRPDSHRPERLMRGGSWNHYIRHSRCAWRHFEYRDNTEPTLGFRLVRSLPAR